METNQITPPTAIAGDFQTLSEDEQPWHSTLRVPAIIF